MWTLRLKSEDVDLVIHKKKSFNKEKNDGWRGILNL